MRNFDTRGPVRGKCNICGETAALTVDHTPPKGYAPALPVRIAHLAERLGSTASQLSRKSPDGLKYRSLCQRCNSELLGTQYDPTLIRLAKDVTCLLESELLLPGVTSVVTKPQRLARSVLGHIAAQGVARELPDEALRSYLMDPFAIPPGNIRLHYWVYPHAQRLLMRDAVITELGSGNTPSTIWLMKCFPLAFAATWEETYRFEGMYQPRNFDPYLHLGVDDAAELPIDLTHVPHRAWPEHPQGSTVLLLGEQAVTATVSPYRSRMLRT